MGKWHIYRDMSKAAELTELLGGKLGIRNSEGKGFDREKA